MSLPKIQKILVLDDDKIQHFLLKKKLNLLFPEVEVILKSSPQDAIDFLGINQVDLILLDLNLPEMSGWEIIELLKENLIQSKLVLVSGSVNSEDKQKAMHDNFIHGIYEKPLKETDLHEIFDV